MKTKIAFIVAVPLSAQVFLKDHFRELVKLYDIHLIANFSNVGARQEFIDMGITCHNIHIERSININKDIKALLQLRKLFKKEKFVSTHSVTPKAGLLTAISSWMAGVKIRIHIYTGQVWATKKGFMRWMLKQMDKITALFDTNILVDGESQRQFLIKEGVLKDKNSKVLANGSICGVRMERFIISSDVRIKERMKFGFTESDVVYIFLGRLNHDKGIGELYEAFNKLSVECPNAKLLLYGTDEEGYEAKAINYPNLKRDINFFYPGRTSTPFEALQCGDVFVLPTWREGFGSSVLEAQALGLPVITSDAYGVVDASLPNETGLRSKVGDADSLYQCMTVYYNDSDMRKKHGVAGRKRVEEKFNNNLVTAAWLEYYNQIL
ncbi:glycosyltransferase involved in cell wall biosynthesis [Dysgonomonadaceae bacterium PH5-43]|nr:glycosyltransferase involved in cell wall biosynthesis [Dysgonomonadaceae bacterium PH5-43]